jgi:hypothetical protein
MFLAKNLVLARKKVGPKKGFPGEKPEISPKKRLNQRKKGQSP